MDFSKVTSLQIPEGNVTKIQDKEGNILWSNINKVAELEQRIAILESNQAA